MLQEQGREQEQEQELPTSDTASCDRIVHPPPPPTPSQVCCAGSRLLVQESVASDFARRLKARMQTLRVGHCLDKCLDMAALAMPDRVGAVQVGR